MTTTGHKDAAHVNVIDRNAAVCLGLPIVKRDEEEEWDKRSAQRY